MRQPFEFRPASCRRDGSPHPGCFQGADRLFRRLARLWRHRPLPKLEWKYLQTKPKTSGEQFQAMLPVFPEESPSLGGCRTDNCTIDPDGAHPKVISEPGIVIRPLWRRSPVCDRARGVLA